MFTIYQSNQSGHFQMQEKMIQNCWVSLIAPTENEVKMISKQLAIPEDFINAALDSNEQSRIHRKGDYLLVAANVPFATGDEVSMPYKTVPIGIIHTPSAIVTICAVDYPILQMINEQQIRGSLTQEHNAFTLQLLCGISSHYIRCLNDIDQQVAAIEGKLKDSIGNEQIFHLLNHNKSLIAFNKSLIANYKVIKKLTKDKKFKNDEQDEKRLLDVVIETKQAIDTSRIHNTNLSGLMDAYAAMIENNMSRVVQKLTVYMIVIAITMGVASIYGMNTPLPLQDEPYMLTVIMSICLVICVLFGSVFYKKRLF